MSQQKAIVIGASGMVGSYLVSMLLKDPFFEKVTLLLRKELTIKHPRLHQCIADFKIMNDIDDCIENGDILFSCIGTTMAGVEKDKKRYRQIDHGIPVKVSNAALEKGYKKLLIVTSVGANKNSSNFYLKLKGEIENDLLALPFKSINFFRPSMLLGDRREKRRGETFMQSTMKYLSILLFGPLSRFHASFAEDVACAMVNQSKLNDPGIHYFHYDEILKLSKTNMDPHRK